MYVFPISQTTALPLLERTNLDTRCSSLRQMIHHKAAFAPLLYEGVHARKMRGSVCVDRDGKNEGGGARMESLTL